ncbi:hypothetical protein D3C75_657140 [compost metagenome]
MHCSGITADLAWRFFTIHNCAIGDDDSNGIAGISRFFHHVVIHTGVAEIFVFFVPAKLFHHGFIHGGAAGQFIYQLVIQRVFCCITTEFLQAIKQTLRTREYLSRRYLAVSGNRCEIVLPQLTNPAAIGFTRSRGHIVTNIRFHGRLIGADAEDVRGDFQLIQQRFVIQGVCCKTV